MTDKRKIDPATGTETTGHSWDGIEELNTPLPRWWLWTFYATVVWGVIYTILYPAWPMVSGATAGLLGYSTRLDRERYHNVCCYRCTRCCAFCSEAGL